MEKNEDYLNQTSSVKSFFKDSKWLMLYVVCFVLTSIVYVSLGANESSLSVQCYYSVPLMLYVLVVSLYIFYDCFRRKIIRFNPSYFFRFIEVDIWFVLTLAFLWQWYDVRLNYEEKLLPKVFLLYIMLIFVALGMKVIQSKRILKCFVFSAILGLIGYAIYGVTKDRFGIEVCCPYCIYCDIYPTPPDICH